jgi:hypothetical protein
MLGPLPLAAETILANPAAGEEIVIPDLSGNGRRLVLKI